MKEFEGKVAVVTGAASGIGRALAERFAQLGMSVVLADFEKAALDATAREFRQREFEVLPVFADVSKRGSIDALRDEALKRFGAVHILVNNAGVAGGGRGPIWETTDDDWDWTFQINFWGVLNGIRSFVPAMLAHGEAGHIVNTASVAGLIGGNGIYGISKHGVVAMTEALYQNLRAVESRLGASVLCPPFVKTNIFESERNRPGVKRVESLAPLGLLERAMEPEAIAEAVIEGIRADQLYVVPESEFDPVWKTRFENIAARRNPVGMMAPDTRR
jgi:NAD(P)-dependent dehydrogenase (short-subunit alcohol dehydrogenase family)